MVPSFAWKAVSFVLLTEAAGISIPVQIGIPTQLQLASKASFRVFPSPSLHKSPG